MAGDIADIGARLVLMDRAAYISGMDEATAANKKFAASITAAAKTSSAAADKMAVSQAKMADATKATTDASIEHAAAVSDVAAVTATKSKAVEDDAAKTKASTAATKDATSAVKKHESALAALASNSVIKKTATWGTAGLLAGAYESVKTYTDFNKAVTQSAVDAGQKVKNLPKVTTGILNISKETGVNAKDVADQFYRISSAANGLGKTNAQIMALTKNAAQLVVLGNVAPGAQTEQIGRIYGAMLAAKLPGATSPKQITQLVNSAVGHGDIRMGDMIGAVGKLLPAAKAVGASAPDTMAWIDTLTKMGMQGSTAGTLVNHSLQQLAHPTELGGNAETMVGIAPGSLQAMVRSKGLGPTISYLGNQLKHWNPESYYPTNTIGGSRNAPGEQSAEAQFQAWNITDPTTMAKFFAGQKLTQSQQDGIVGGLLAKIFGNAKSATPALALMNDPAQFQRLIASINAGATPGALKKSLNAAMNTPGRQMDIARANVAATGIAIGKDLTPAATTFLKDLGSVAGTLAAHPDLLKGLLAGLTALVGSAVLVSGANKLSKLASGLAELGRGLNNIPNSIANIFGKGSTAAAATGLDGSAAALNESAAALTGAAEKLSLAGAGKGIPGVGGAGKTVAADAEAAGGAAAGAEAASPLTLTGLAGGAAAPLAGLGAVLGTVGAAMWLDGAFNNSNHNPVLGLAGMNRQSLNILGSMKFSKPLHLSGLNLNGAVPPLLQPGAVGKPPPSYFGNMSSFFGPSAPKAPHNNTGNNALNNAIGHLNTIFTHIGSLGLGAGKITTPKPANNSQVTGAEKSAATAMQQAANKHLSAAQRYIDSANAGKQAATAQREAGNNSKTAASDQKQAANLEKTASTQSGQAAKTSQSAAKTMDGAAKDHSAAASALKAAASALEAASKSLGSVKITASVDPGSIAAAVKAQSANTGARK